jgi:hypothetical protein
MAILTASEIATLIGASPTAQLSALIDGVEAWVQRECNTYVQATVTEVYDGSGVPVPGMSPWLAPSPLYPGLSPRQGSTMLVLRRAPILEDSGHTFTLKIATDAARDFASATAITRSYYYVDTETGVVVYEGGFPAMPRCVAEADYPADLKALIAEMCGLAINRIGAAGLSSENAGGYSFVLQNFGSIESQLSALGSATLESYRAKGSAWCM